MSRKKPEPIADWSRNTGLPVDAANSLATDGSVVVPLSGYYSVRLGNGTLHQVLKSRECREHGTSCPAVLAVSRYIIRGGTRADDYVSRIPEVCPICGGVIHHYPALSSKIRGEGWICGTPIEKKVLYPGDWHYWLWFIEGVKEAFHAQTGKD